jgi:hypothetical protein
MAMKNVIRTLFVAGLTMLAIGLFGIMANLLNTDHRDRPEPRRASFEESIAFNTDLAALARSIPGSESVTASVDGGDIGDLIRGGIVKFSIDVEVNCPSSVVHPSTFLIETHMAVNLEDIGISELRTNGYSDSQIQQIIDMADRIVDAMRGEVGDRRMKEILLGLLPSFELSLAGADVMPLGPVRLGLDGRALWSVSPREPKRYEGVIRPTNPQTQRASSGHAAWWPDNYETRFDFVAEKPKEPIINMVFSLDLSVVGSLVAAISGIASLAMKYDERKKRRNETARNTSRQ